MHPPKPFCHTMTTPNSCSPFLPLSQRDFLIIFYVTILKTKLNVCTLAPVLLFPFIFSLRRSTSNFVAWLSDPFVLHLCFRCAHLYLTWLHYVMSHCHVKLFHEDILMGCRTFYLLTALSTLSASGSMPGQIKKVPFQHQWAKGHC